MISALDSSTDRFLNDLAATSRRIDRAQQQLTSSKRITAPSDDPDQVGSLVQYKSELARADQAKIGLSRVKTEVDTSESALSSAVQLVESARVIAARGATSTATADMRQSMADELTGILQQLVATANTSVGGRYVFSGDNDQQPPYSIDTTQASPVSEYAGTDSTRQIPDATGSTFPTSLTARQIFDSATPGESVFAAVNALRLALQADDPAQIAAATADIASAGTYLEAQHAYYGTVQNRVNQAVNDASAIDLRLQSNISAIEDVDMVRAATELTQAESARNTALAARSHTSRVSLFDYLG
jgi:flagellar hook-associated protein 3 FlgL